MSPFDDDEGEAQGQIIRHRLGGIYYQAITGHSNNYELLEI